jgi:hypothetical protein
MRLVTQRARTAMYAQETDEVFLTLLVLTHATLPEGPLRFVNNLENITSTADGTGAHDYIAMPFQIQWPSERGEQLPVVQIALDNVHPAIADTIRSIQTPPTLTIYLVLAATPNIVEAGPVTFTLKNARYDVAQVSGSLAFADVLNESFPWRTFTPQDWPGCFV